MSSSGVSGEGTDKTGEDWGWRKEAETWLFGDPHSYAGGFQCATRDMSDICVALVGCSRIGDGLTGSGRCNRAGAFTGQEVRTM